MSHPEAKWRSVETCLALPPTREQLLRDPGADTRFQPLEPSRAERVDVAYVAESTYPYHRGGAASIIHEMISGMPELTFGIIYVTWDRTTHAAGLAYELPPNVRWIDHVYLSVKEQAPLPRASALRRWLFRRARRRAVRGVLDGVAAALRGDTEAAARVLRERLLTRRGHEFWRAYAGREFLEALTDAHPTDAMSLPDLFWLQRELSTILYAVFARSYPPAAVYHAHIQLSGALAAICGAAQHDGRSVLTEHSLYVRDSLNYTMGRCPSFPASPVADPDEAGADARARAWMRWFRTVGRVVYAMVDAGTYQYQRQLDDAVSFGAASGKARLISNGLDTTRYAAARAAQDARARDRAAAGAAWSWRFAYMGRIVALKGVVEAIQAAALLHDAGLAFAMDLVGPVGEEPEYVAICEALVAELGLQERVRLTGTKNLGVALGQYDVVLLPSYTEALPIVVLEAMCSSCPVVGTDVGSIAQVLSEEVTTSAGERVGAAGVIVPPRDAKAIATALAALTADPARLAAYRTAGPRRIAARHLSCDVMNAYKSLYKDLTRSSASVVKLIQDERLPLQGTERAGAPGLLEASP